MISKTMKRHVIDTLFNIDDIFFINIAEGLIPGLLLKALYSLQKHPDLVTIKGHGNAKWIRLERQAWAQILSVPVKSFDMALNKLMKQGFVKYFTSVPGPGMNKVLHIWLNIEKLLATESPLPQSPAKQNTYSSNQCDNCGNCEHWFVIAQSPDWGHCQNKSVVAELVDVDVLPTEKKFGCKFHKR